MTVEPLAAAISRKVFGIWARKGDPTKAEGTWHVVHGTGKFVTGMSAAPGPRVNRLRYSLA
jgi:hypothetical protein